MSSSPNEVVRPRDEIVVVQRNRQNANRSTSARQSNAGIFRLTGFPKNVSQQQVTHYVKVRCTVQSLETHSRSASAVLVVASKSAVSKLKKHLRQNLFQDQYAIRMGKEEASSSPAVSSSNNTLPLVLASEFHQYICQEDHRLTTAGDRQGTSLVFQEFLQQTNVSHRGSLEADVMRHLRRLKLVRSKRQGNVVLMTYANRDGQFPSRTEQKSAAARILLARLEDERNKEHVVVSDTETGPVAPLGKAVKQTWTLECSEEGNHPQWTGVVVGGPHRGDVSSKQPKLPQPLQRTCQFTLSCTPNRIGIFRVQVTFCFETRQETPTRRFQIVRYWTVRSGDPKLDQLLQPKTPYQPFKYQSYPPKLKETFGPPPIANRGGDANPFATLSHYNVPDKKKELILDGEFENVVRDDDMSNDKLEHYGPFWQNLLWASEVQAERDIQLFDMNNVSFEQRGHLYGLRVPGLAENRPSILRGDLVHVTWNKKLYKGRVQQVQLLDVWLEFPKAFDSYKPGVDRVDLVRFTYSRMTFRTSHEACRHAASTLKRELLFPDPGHVERIPQARQAPSVWRWANRSLNPEQQAMIRKVVVGEARPLPYICFGPPGTGKTTTVVEAVFQLARHKDNLNILLVAPSNDAADILVERLAPHFSPLELHRVLAYSRSSDTVPAAIRPYVSQEGATPEELRAFILSARIVVATVNLAARFTYFGIKMGHFDVLCVDEAGHATEPEVIAVASSLINFHNKADGLGQLVLAGDPKQLGPIISSPICQKFGMEVSYMERLMNRKVYSRNEGNYPPSLLTKLVRNYRSHPAVLKLPNEMFYDDELQCCGDKMSTHSMTRWEYLPNKSFPVLFQAVNGDNLRESRSPSWFNPQEVQQVCEYVNLLMKQTRPPLSANEIGIITPYHRQAQKIRLALQSQDISEDIKVGSVETFQGQERRCIIVSTVRADAKFLSSDLRYNLGFVANKKRFNVAVTRAKSLLIVIGCPEVLAMDKENWFPFLCYCHENKSWVGEDWNPEDVVNNEDEEEDDDEDNEGEDAPEQDMHGEWEIVPDETPSNTDRQEAVAFIRREE